MLVAITGMSLLAFIVFDAVNMRTGEVGVPVAAVMMAAIIGGLMWAIGSRRGKGQEWGVTGALIGAVAAVVSGSFSGPPPVAASTLKKYYQADVLQLKERRRLANQFLMLANETVAEKTGDRNRMSRQNSFGPIDGQALIVTDLLRRDLARAGAVVSDDAVNRFIKNTTSNQLSSKEFRDILRDLQIGESRLYELLKDELLAMWALKNEAAPRSGNSPLRTPLEYWEDFRKLSVKQDLSVVALPVREFLSLVPEPSDSEIAGFFEQYKTFPPSTDGTPGFLQPRKVGLAYVTGDYEKVEAAVPPPTEAEILAYYEQNKERYVISEVLSTPAPKLPAPSDPAGATPAATPAPTDAAPADGTGTTPASDPAPAADGAPDTDPAPAAEAPAAETPAKEAPSSEAPPVEPPAAPAPGEAEQKSGARLGRGIAVRLVNLTQTAEGDAATEPAAAPAEPTAPAAPAEPAAPPAASAEPTTPAEATTTSEPAPSEAGPTIELPPSPSSAAAPAPPAAPKRYLPLDDVREAIQDELLKQRTREKMNALADAAFEHMMMLTQDISGMVEGPERTAASVGLNDKLKAYAAEQGLIYREIPTASRETLVLQTEETLLNAVEPSANPRAAMSGLPVVDTLFGRESALFLPRRANALAGGNSYAFWKIEDRPQQVGKLSDEGMKDRVVKDWKLSKARDLAKARGEELLAQVNVAVKAGQPLSGVIAGQTVNGQPATTTEAEFGTSTGPAVLTITETNRFSWLVSRRNVPAESFMAGGEQPRLSLIDGVSNPGMDFYETVADKMSVGEVRLLPNGDRSAWYIVQLKSRDGVAADGSPDAAVQAALQREFGNETLRSRFWFMPSAYDHLAAAQANARKASQEREIESRFKLEWYDQSLLDEGVRNRSRDR